jgi:N-acetylglucosaminyldiphosphoundecaprenol N-acetyl-beta-D-mannosaminyltransferase
VTGGSRVTDTVEFLGFDFARGSRSELMSQVLARASQPYSFAITPNVDFITRAAKTAGVMTLYGQAAIQICDSRILALLAKTQGIELDCYPGSDMVADLLKQNSELKISVIGPSMPDWLLLIERFPSAQIDLILSPPFMTPGDFGWETCLKEAAETKWDILLICLGSPKQERFAADLAQVRKATGVAICAGASIDFLTGNQIRAPLWMQKASLEWLHRLTTNPGRLWRRYLVDGPSILLLLAKQT